MRIDWGMKKMGEEGKGDCKGVSEEARGERE
jgi:hypothetical protein